MLDPQVFYNREDLWAVPRRTVEGRDREMEPYYTIMRLPGESKEEFILLTLFNPSRRDNMIGWLAARSDPPNYGRLIAYNFPKQKLVYGPRQIDARIDQDPVISQQLSLWNQRGFHRDPRLAAGHPAGPVLDLRPAALPRGLRAGRAAGAPPRDRRHGNQIAMEATLESSLSRIFGGRLAALRPRRPPPPPRRAPRRRRRPRSPTAPPRSGRGKPGRARRRRCGAATGRRTAPSRNASRTRCVRSPRPGGSPPGGDAVRRLGRPAALRAPPGLGARPQQQGGAEPEEDDVGGPGGHQRGQQVGAREGGARRSGPPGSRP